jgi:pectin methylesterase-like acyl-CoA thioesterase
MNPLLAAGTYTIGGPTPTATNFVTFKAAVDALICGFTGHIIFNVLPGTYTEQVRIPKLTSSSA